MRERISRLAKGIIDMEAPVLTVQPMIIEEELKAGERGRGDLFIVSENGVYGKGVVYSSDPRVKVLGSSFGGIRSHIGYEVSIKGLEYGDVIEGSFYLVTNGGEKEVPYSFRMEAANSGKILSQLKRARDFAALARRDYDLALRLFEFKDFVEAPFMQDMHIRAIYDGLRGQGNRFGQLEQFFIALEIKEPVKLKVEELKKEYYASDQTISDVVEIHKEGWGYLPITIKTDGEFIQSLHKTINDSDFIEGVCKFPYQIDPSALHGGKNYGSITVETMYETITVVIEAHGVPVKKERLGVKRYGRYLSLRLDYESQKEKTETLNELMIEELEQIRMTRGQSTELSLLQAELMSLLGNNEEAKTYLEECKKEVYEKRMEKREWYCAYEYAFSVAFQDQEKRESLRRLLEKYMEDEQANYLLFYFYTMCDENWTFENPGEVLSQLKVLYGKGCHSPFLYQQVLNLWNQMPQLLYGIGAMELQVLNYGASRKLLYEELAIKVAKLSEMNKHYQPLCCRMLKNLYGCFPKKEILEAVCSQMIRGGCQKESDFIWYEQAVQQQLSLTRLYEHFLYSLPRGYNQAIPKQALLYFGYEHDLKLKSKEVLYENVLHFFGTETKLYKDYEKVISQFAVEQALKSRISRRLAVIYDKMIYADMIDSALAKALPSLLRSYRIRCSNPQMKYVVACYEELTEEAVYLLENGIAYVPIFSNKVTLLFQDSYGNRYTQISHIKTRALNKPELEERCFELEPKQPMLLLAACKKTVDEEINKENKEILERAVSQLSLHPLYYQKLVHKLTEYYQSEECKKEDVELLPVLAEEAELLTKKQRDGLCEALIRHDYIKEAFGMINQYACKIKKESLQKLCNSMIVGKMFDEKELLLYMSFKVYEKELTDNAILGYLCEHFNGTCKEMYEILIASVKEKAETYDMEERLLGQMMFTREISKLDQVFALYLAKKETKETIVKAYFTIKSAEYFLHDIPASDKVFDYLEGVIKNTKEKEKLSTIYLLALSKYYSGLPKLEEEQKQLCQFIVDQLLEEGMVFPYFKQLSGKIQIPEEILDQGILQYIGHEDSKIELQIRILPNEEEFHRDDMRRVYQGVFIKQKILFEGEIMEYEIYEQKNNEKVLVKEGSIACDIREDRDKSGRFSLLNQMSLCLSLKEEQRLKETMEEYIQKNATIEKLFQLL